MCLTELKQAFTGGRPSVGRSPVPCVAPCRGVVYKLSAEASGTQTLLVDGGVFICIRAAALE